jgi:hypothetical protein
LNIDSANAFIYLILSGRSHNIAFIFIKKFAKKAEGGLEGEFLLPPVLPN